MAFQDVGTAQERVRGAAVDGSGTDGSWVKPYVITAAATLGGSSYPLPVGPVMVCNVVIAAADYDITLPNPASCPGLKIILRCITSAGTNYVGVVGGTGGLGTEYAVAHTNTNGLNNAGDAIIAESVGVRFVELGKLVS